MHDALAEAFAASPAGWGLVTPDGRLADANPALCRMLGYDRAEVLGVELWDLVADRDDERDARERRVLATGSVEGFRQDRRLLRGDGPEAIGHVVGALVRDADGRPRYWSCVVEDVTHARRAVDLLAENEERLAEAQHLARLGSWEIDVAADRLRWSAGLLEILGLGAAEAPASFTAALDFVHPVDRERCVSVVRSAIEARRGWAIDFRLVRPDDHVIHVHARGEVVTAPDGSVTVVRGTCQDVTERRRVEDALRDAEQLFRRAFDDAPIGMALLDVDRRWLRTNPALCRMLGRTEDELRGTSIDCLAVEADRGLDGPRIGELLSGASRSFAAEKRLVHADGSVLNVVQHMSLLLGGDRPVSFLCQLVDVTDRRRVEAERRAGDVRLQAIVDNAPAVIFVKDTEGRFALVNRRWEALYGVDRQEAVGRRPAEILGEEEGERLERLDRQVLDGVDAVETLAPVATVTGARVELLTLQFPIFDGEGHVAGLCGIATDVTERRRSAGERAELERRLAQAERLETVGRLAGGVAHDFNNLLSVILTCAGFALREAPAGSALHEDVDEIRRAAERAARLVRQLLIFSRREVVQPEVVDLRRLVGDVDRLLRRSLSERVRLEVVRDPAVPRVLADPARLEQVLLNLVLNARDALGDDGGTVRVVLGRSPGGSARIAVADDGPGMAPEVAERAFEPFFTTKPSGEGTGLGLATVQGIVADSGGTVELESAPGEGTVVTIDLPATDAIAADPVATPVSGGVGSPGTVLLAEDQPPVRRQARRILESAGYAVVEARDGEEALAALDGSVDLLLTDVVMPGLGGPELAERATALHPGLRVVVMSGHTEDAVLRAGVREGGVGFVQKPFSEASLLQAVAVALAPEGIA